MPFPSIRKGEISCIGKTLEYAGCEKSRLLGAMSSNSVGTEKDPSIPFEADQNENNISLEDVTRKVPKEILRAKVQTPTAIRKSLQDRSFKAEG